MMKVTRLLLSAALVAVCTFAVAAEKAPEPTSKSEILKEREQAIKDESSPVFDSKDVLELKPVEAAKNSSDTKIEAIKAGAKEADVPLVADTVKNKSKEVSSPIRVIISLVAVFALLIGGTLFLKKWSKKRNTEGASLKIRVLTQHYLGPKKSIAIIQVAGESLLIGVTEQNISMLKTLALIDDEVPANEQNKFPEALDNYEETEDFALHGISEIRDVVSKRLKGMRSLE